MQTLFSPLLNKLFCLIIRGNYQIILCKPFDDENKKKENYKIFNLKNSR